MASGAGASGGPIRRWKRNSVPGGYFSGLPTQLHRKLPSKDGSSSQVDGLRIQRRPGSGGNAGNLRDTWTSTALDVEPLQDVESDRIDNTEEAAIASIETFTGECRGSAPTSFVRALHCCRMS
jgi:hypothetical protein